MNGLHIGKSAEFARFRFLSADGKTQIAAYLAEPPAGTEIRGVVQMCHGMCEYMERYADFARYLCMHGYVFCGHDHLGHGYSAPDEQALGYTGSAAYLIEDTHTLTDLMQRRYPGKPYILAGHSMGSFVVRNYLSRYGKQITAAVLIGTAGPGMPTGVGKGLARLMMALGFDRHRSALLHTLAFATYNRRFRATKSNYAWISRDEAILRKYEQDPFCTFVFTARGFYDLFDLLGAVSRRCWAESLPATLPMLLMSGEEDPVGAYGKGVRRLYARMQAAGMQNVHLKLYPGDRHEILNELDRAQVYADFLAFCNAHCPFTV